MGREIKFRQALFNADGSFREWHTWGFVEMYSNLVWVGPEIHYSTHKGALEHSYQFTGLHDKNGVEIYEGDIVRYEGLMCTVEWCGQELGWRLYRGCMYKASYKPDVPWWEALNWQNIEVIGNIYENLELLEQ